MTTSYGDTKFVEFHKSSSGFINKQEFEKQNTRMRNAAKMGSQEEIEENSVFDQFKNTTNNSNFKKSFKEDFHSNITNSKINPLLSRKKFNMDANPFANANSIVNNKDKDIEVAPRECGFTTKSQFFPFKTLIQADEKLNRDIQYFSNSGDHMNLIRYKLQSNKMKSQNYIEDSVRNELLKKHFFSTMVDKHDEKMELMNSITQVIKRKVTVDNKYQTSNNPVKYSKKNKDNSQESKKKVSEFESLFRSLDYCFSNICESSRNICRPDSREGHTMNLINYGDKKIVVLYGGLSGSIYNDFDGFEVGRWSWKTLTQFGAKDAWDPRFGHTLNSFGKKIIVFGGCKSYSSILTSLTCSNELIVYDMNDKSMNTIRSPFGGPVGRKYHASIMVNTNLYVIGGINSKNHVLNDIWSYNFGIKKWNNCRVDYKEVPDIGENGIAQITAHLIRSNPDSKKDKDDPNCGYAEGIYIFGGKNEFAEANNNLLVLKINDSPVKFIKLQTKGESPEPRFGHSMCF